MDRRVVLLVALLVVVPASGAVGVDVLADAQQLELDEERTVQVLLQNDQPRSDTYAVTVSTSSSAVLATVATEDRAGDRIEVGIAGDSQRTVALELYGAQCAQRSCTARVTVTARSLLRDRRAADTVTVDVQRPTRRYDAPGIGLFQVLALLVAGLFVVVRTGGGRGAAGRSR